MRQFCIQFYPRPKTQSDYEMQLAICKLKQKRVDIPIYAAIVSANDYEDSIRRFMIDTISKAKATNITNEIFYIDEIKK